MIILVFDLIMKFNGEGIMDIFKHLLLIGLCFNMLQLHAQHDLSGSIYNENKEPLVGATIMLVTQDTIAGGAVSDHKGKFKIQGLSSGEYKYVASMLGFKPEEEIIQLSGNLSLGAILLKEESKELSEVVINADRRNIITQGAGMSTFRLSDKALKSKSVYEALYEIPKLLVNETDRSIKLANGKSPLILVNGVNRPGYINSLNPGDIESVEVIDNPSARYRGDQSVQAILNIKTKKRIDAYVNGNLYSKHNAEGVFGVTGLSAETGNSKFSVYLNAQNFYFHDDDSEIENRISSDDSYRELKGLQRYKSNMVYAHLGGDWILNDKNYWAFGVSITTNPSKIHALSSGRISEELPDNILSSLDVTQSIDNRYLKNNYNVYYNHSFNNNSHLEVTGGFGLYTSGAAGNRNETTDQYKYTSITDLDNVMKHGLLELNYDGVIVDKVSFDVGANTYYTQTQVKDQTLKDPKFLYKDFTEYVYASIRNKQPSKFSYMISLGLDMVFTDVDRHKEQYFNFVPSASLGYNVNQQSNWQLSYNRSRTSPEASQLNPRNTSLDSMVMRIGNPGLKPSIDNIVRLSYSWNHKGFYLEPYLIYDYMTKQVEQIGILNDNVYTYTYENMTKKHQFLAGIQTRVNLSTYGNLNFSAYYQKDKMDEFLFNGNSLGVNAFLYLYYKKVSLSLYTYYTSARYTKTTKTQSTPESEATFSWSLPKNWQLQLGLRYFAAKNNCMKSWTENKNYHSYAYQKMTDRFLMPMIGISYTFRNKTPYKWRQKKNLQKSDTGVSNIKVE